MVNLALVVCCLFVALCRAQPPGYSLGADTIETPFLLRSQIDESCFLAIGNSASAGHGLDSGEFNVFFDCDEGGHSWTYEVNGTESCPACEGWFLYADDFWYAQLQFDWNPGVGFNIGPDQYNVKIDTEYYSYAYDSFRFDTSRSTLWVFDIYMSEWCALQHFTGQKTLYDKWISSSETRQVYGYEAFVDCDPNQSPLPIDVLFSHPATTAATAGNELMVYLEVEDHGCASHVNIGTFDTVEECALSAVGRSECTGNQLMWSWYSINEPTWGCRCCRLYDDIPGGTNTNWDIYKYEYVSATTSSTTALPTQTPTRVPTTSTDIPTALPTEPPTPLPTASTSIPTALLEVSTEPATNKPTMAPSDTDTPSQTVLSTTTAENHASYSSTTTTSESTSKPHSEGEVADQRTTSTLDDETVGDAPSTQSAGESAVLVTVCAVLGTCCCFLAVVLGVAYKRTKRGEPKPADAEENKEEQANQAPDAEAQPHDCELSRPNPLYRVASQSQQQHQPQYPNTVLRMESVVPIASYSSLPGLGRPATGSYSVHHLQLNHSPYTNTTPSSFNNRQAQPSLSLPPPGRHDHAAADSKTYSVASVASVDEAAAERAKIRDWLKRRVQLTQHYSSLIRGGYASLELIKLMQRENLLEVGIVDPAHQQQFLTAIVELKSVGVDAAIGEQLFANFGDVLDEQEGRGREESASASNRSDSSNAMHEDHYAVDKVTNYYGLEEEQNGDQNVENPFGTQATQYGEYIE